MACMSVWACKPNERTRSRVDMADHQPKNPPRLRLDGTTATCFSFRSASTLLNHRTRHIRRATRVVVNLARLVREEAPLPGSPHLVRHSGDGIGTDRAVHLFSRSVGEGVAALAAAGQIGVDGLLAAALRSAAEGDEVRGESHIRMTA